MADENSFSEWESVNDDDSSQSGETTNNNEINATISRVEVELPPEFVPGEARSTQQISRRNLNLLTPRNDPSSIGSTFLREVEHWNFDTKTNDETSTVSSFIPVSRMAKMPLPSCSCSYSSGWQTESQQPSEILYAATQWTDATESTVGSLASNFDIISLTSGYTVMRCRRCKYHNHHDAKICSSCDFALVPNPCVDIDEQIALSLQQKEDQYALHQLVEKENKLKRIREDNVFVQASHLTQEINSFAMGYGSKGFELFPTRDMEFLAASFILHAKTIDRAAVSLLYTFTSSDVQTYDTIRMKGFAMNSYVVVSSNVEAALKVTCESPELVSSWREFPRRETLACIPEDEEGRKTEGKSHRGWIVAVATSEKEFVGKEIQLRNETAIVQKLGDYREVLPLICFDAEKRNQDEARLLVDGLANIFWDFFDFSLGRLATRNIDESSYKKPRTNNDNKIGESELGIESSNVAEWFADFDQAAQQV